MGKKAKVYKKKIKQEEGVEIFKCDSCDHVSTKKNNLVRYCNSEFEFFCDFQCFLYGNLLYKQLKVKWVSMAGSVIHANGTAKF